MFTEAVVASTTYLATLSCNAHSSLVTLLYCSRVAWTKDPYDPVPSTVNNRRCVCSHCGSTVNEHLQQTR